MTQDYYASESTKRYDIPLTHLDYGYIRECNDVKELEKILRVLRSGDEGYFPDLEREAEGRLELLNPKSRVLRKDNPALRLDDLDKTERDDLSHDLETWKSEMANKEGRFGSSAVTKMSTAEDDTSAFDDDPSLPPVRSGKVISVDGKVKESSSTSSEKAGKKKAMPRSYKEWDKFDIDKELEKAEEEQPSQKTTDVTPSTFKPERIAHKIDTQGMTMEEKNAKAIREKEKGNEAFHAHDYEESILYYSRSLSIAPLAATYNNRALAYLRTSRWKEAINDCNTVLKLEPKNVKALLRRGTALKGKQDLVAARADLEAVLALEANNKTAQDQLKEIDKLEEKVIKEKEERKKKGRRMIIEEVEGSDEENDEDVTEEIIVEKPDKKTEEAPLVNGHAEEVTPKTSHQETLAESVEETKVPSKASSQPPPEEQQENPSDSKDDTKKNQDIWTEEEASAPQQQPTPAEDKKPKLVTTSILSDQWQKVPGRKGQSHTEKAAEALKGSGDSESISGTSASAETTDIPSSDKSSVERVTEAVQNGQGDADENAADDETHSEEKVSVESEPVHSRPVFVQRVLPSEEAGLREKGNNFFRSGQYPEAIKVYTSLINRLEKAPDQAVNLSLIYSNRAACHLKTGDCQSAITDCTTSLSLVPHAAKPLLRRASAYETMEKYRQAYVDYKHVITVDSSSVLAHQGATRCQKHLQDMDGIQWRDKCPPLVRVSQWDVPEVIDEASNSEREKVLQQSASMPSQQKQKAESSSPTPQKAAVAEEESTKRAPDPEEVFEETKAKGNKHVQKGDYEAAAKCYCQCVELFADRPAVYTNRALCYLRLNKAKEAEADCDTALKLEPNNSKAFYRRALARKEQKHYKESLQDLLQLLRLEPSNSAAKKEVEAVKKLYKQEYDQMKSQPAPEKQKPPEKQRKRMKIEEIDDDSDTEKKDSQPQQTPTTKPKASAPQNTQPPPPQSPAASDKQSGARPQQESRKPGRGKSKKGGTKETSVGLPVTPPSAPKLQGKITPFEFIQHWNSLKQAKEIQPYVQLLEQISPDDLPGVISNKLDGHMLQIITRCAAHDAQTGEVERAYSILRNLRQVPRFSTVSMFLSNKEKQDIRKVLESISSLGTHSADDVSSVRKDYGLK